MPTDNTVDDLESFGQRRIAGWAGKVVAAAAILLTLYTVFYILDLFGLLGVFIETRVHLAVFLSLSLFLTFLVIPIKKGLPMHRLPRYDVVLAIVGLIGPGYLAAFVGKIEEQHDLIVGSYEVVLGIVTILLVLEASRRLVGWVFVALTGVFVLYAKFSDLLPGLLQGRGYSLTRVVEHMYISGDGIMGIPMEMAATVIFVFILFGQLLYFGGAGRWFIDLAQSVAGHTRGGPAKAAVVASAMFGTISGSPLANVCTIGIITIPLMKKVGYRPHFAAAVETVASTGGMIMPPVMGVVAFIMADYIKIPYATIALAALLPAVLYYIALFFQVDGEAVLLGLKGMPRRDLPSFKKTFAGGWYYLIPFAILVYYLFALGFDPSVAGLYAAGAMVLVLLIASAFKRKAAITPRTMFKTLETTSYGTLVVTLACAASGLLIGSVSLTGLGIRFSQLILTIAGGNQFLILVLTAAASTIMGMGLPVIPCYLLLAILVAPALVQTGVSVLAAHLFILYFGALSFITPPVAPAVFAAAPLAGAPIMKTGWQAMRLAVVAYIVPFMFIYYPALLLIGSPVDITIAVVTALIGVVALAGGVEGCLFQRVNWWQRSLLIVGGVLLIVPSILSSIVGAALVALVVAYQRLVQKPLQASLAGTGGVATSFTSAGGAGAKDKEVP